MTRLIQDDGRVIPLTVIKCEPNEVTQIKTVDKDGYPAIVLGFSKLRKPTKTKKFYHLREFAVSEDQLETYKTGDAITLEKFEKGEELKLTSVSKGKGFQGVIKRHNFSRGPESHGSHHHREPGSVGACAKPGRVAKGKKLPGRMGGRITTLSSVKVELVDFEKNIIGIRGAVPGPNGTLVTLRKA